MQGKKPTEGVITISNSKIEGFKNLKFENNYVTIGEEGMTWEKLANNNEYNTFGVSTGLCMENNLCVGATDRDIWDNEESRFVTSSDIIKENGNYKIDRY